MDAGVVAVSETSPLEWRYTAEGGANLVLSYAGHAEPALVGQALRLRKRKRRPDAAQPIPDRVEARFGESVVHPLLGQDLCLHARIAHLTTKWLESVARMLHQQGARPAERELEDEIDPTAQSGVLVEDLIAGQGVLSIEIKPKWGFLPSPTHLSPATAPLKSTYCRTCLHRAYKQRGKEPAAVDCERGGYCPLDLYSRDQARMAHALRQLWTAWNSSAGEANNLRFFLNGQLVKPGQPETRMFEATLAACSTTSSQEDDNDDHTTPRKGFVSTLLPILLSSSVLPRLSALQAALDPLDIEGLADRIRLETGLDLYDNHEPAAEGGSGRLAPTAGNSKMRVGEGGGGEGQPTLQEWSEWLERWKAAHGGQEARLDDDDDNMAARTDLSPDDAMAPPSLQLRDLVLAYLLSATFKDCSVFIRLPWPPTPSATAAAEAALLQASRPARASASASSSVPVPLPSKPELELEHESESAAAAVVIKVIDLDPKPIARLAKYAKMDRDIVEHYRREIVAVAEREGSQLPKRCMV
ncbi:hypothetical protein JCM3774_006673 [Rhodotorula dairenensis]